MRLFFAIMLPPDVQASVYRLRRELDGLPIRPSCAPQANLHITLKFLGDVSDADAAALAAEVKTAIRAPFPLQLLPDHIVMFPPRGATRVLGVGFSGDVEPLVRLQSDLEALCRRRGLPAENRAYVPHATLAHFREGLHARHRPRILEAWARLSPSPAFVASSFQLMRSVLSSAGSSYTPIATYAAPPYSSMAV